MYFIILYVFVFIYIYIIYIYMIQWYIIYFILYILYYIILIYLYPLKNGIWGGGSRTEISFLNSFLQSCFLNDQYSPSFQVIGKQVKIKYLRLAPEELSTCQTEAAHCPAVIILALSSSDFLTSAQGLLRNVSLQFHSRGWITIPGFTSKKKWNSTGWFCPPPPSPSIGVGILIYYVLLYYIDYIILYSIILYYVLFFVFSYIILYYVLLYIILYYIICYIILYVLLYYIICYIILYYMLYYILLYFILC